MNYEGWEKLTVQQRAYNVKMWILYSFKENKMRPYEVINLFNDINNSSNLNEIAKKCGYLNEE